MADLRPALIVVLCGIAVCLLAQKPLTTKVVSVDNKGVWLKVGSANGVAEGDEFEVYGNRKVVYLPLVGKQEEVVVEKGVVARLAVRKVLENRSLCQVVEGKAAEIKPGMTAVRVPPKRRVARNVAPYVDKLTASQQIALPAQRIRIRCRVTDADDTEHVFIWQATGGCFFPPRTTVPETLWLAPASAGEYSITVRVRDPKGGEASATITVKVKKAEVPPAAYRVDAVFGTIRPPFLYASDVDFDHKGRLIVLDPRQRKLVIFDTDGVALRTTLPYGEGTTISGIRVAGRRYFLSDAKNCRILVYDSETDIFKAKPSMILGRRGTGNGYFSAPPVVDVSPSGRIYCLDPGQGFIHVFNADGGFVHSIGRRGPEPDSFRAPVSLCFDRRGTLYVLDRERKEIIVFKNDTFVGPLPVSEPFASPVWICYDAVGDHLVVLDAGMSALRIFSPDGKEIKRIVGGGLGSLANAYRLAIGPDGNAVVVCKGGILRRYGLANGDFRGALGAVDLWPLKNIAVQPNGSFFVLYGENRIAHLSADGWVLRVFGGEGKSEGRFIEPVAMGCDEDGNLYVADAFTLTITKFNSAGDFQKRFGSEGRSYSERIDSIIDMYVRGKRLYLLQDRETYCVFVFDQNGELVARYPSREGRIEYAAQVTVDSRGNTYIFSEWPDLVRYDVSGLRAGSVTLVNFYVADMLTDNCDQIVALDEDQPKLILIDLSGGVRRLPLPRHLFSQPIAVGLDKYARLYILDEGTGNIVRLVPETE
ncbi:MAG: hypothetical protein DRP82_00570 [Planctomycetota bacterium]|nr:MAG: hypothetical protein DRP82_00570 [Planctomycetota bacterium]